MNGHGVNGARLPCRSEIPEPPHRDMQRGQHHVRRASWGVGVCVSQTTALTLRRQRMVTRLLGDGLAWLIPHCRGNSVHRVEGCLGHVLRIVQPGVAMSRLFSQCVSGRINPTAIPGVTATNAGEFQDRNRLSVVQRAERNAEIAIPIALRKGGSTAVVVMGTDGRGWGCSVMTRLLHIANPSWSPGCCSDSWRRRNPMTHQSLFWLGVVVMAYVVSRRYPAHRLCV